MPESGGAPIEIIPEIPSDSEFHKSNGGNFESKEYWSYLLHMMVVYKASDIYLTYGEVPVLRINQRALRIQGALELTDEMLSFFEATLIKEDIYREHFLNDQSVDIGYSLHGRRYRINVSLQRGHIMIVARLLAEKVPTIDEMGLPSILKRLSHTSGGIIFLSGPTGSGKSTTLAAMIEEINQTKHKHIITIEDPIEYVFQPKLSVFEQKELGKDVPSFDKAMKYAVRQRPDVILFGEVRDAESLRYAMNLAETGHLVFTTIHSRSAEQAINRIVSMFPTDEQPNIQNHLAENMIAIIIQKLVKRKDGNGMIAAHEILLNNTPVSNTIRENKLNQLNNVMFSNKRLGMQLMDDCLVDYVIKGYITMEMAMDNATDQGAIKRGLEQRGVRFG